MDAKGPRDFIAIFNQLPDYRAHNVVHKLTNIVALAIIAVCCGEDTWEDVAEFCEDNIEMLKLFLDLPNGVPSHDTFGRVFRHLDPDAFEMVFQQYTDSLAKAGKAHGIDTTKLMPVAVDGKTIRRSFSDASRSSAVHMVSAWCGVQGLTLGQIATDAKSNEISAIPRLMKMLDLRNRMVTIDAIGCQTKIAKEIREGKGDYILQIKGNQESLLKKTKQAFEHLPAISETDPPAAYQHGRVELRSLRTVSAVEAGVNPEQWLGTQTLLEVRCLRAIKGEISRSRRYYLTSLPAADAEDLLARCRGHWGIENTVHWSLDMTYREDESRIRKDNGAQNMARVRRLAMNLMKKTPAKKKNMSMRGKRKKCGRKPEFLLKVLFNTA